MCSPEQRHELPPATVQEHSPLSRCARCGQVVAPTDQGLEFLFYRESAEPHWEMQRYHLVCFFQFLGAEVVAETVGGSDTEPGTMSVQLVLRNVRPVQADMDRVQAHRDRLYLPNVWSELGPTLDTDDGPEWPDDTPTD